MGAVPLAPAGEVTVVVALVRAVILLPALVCLTLAPAGEVIAVLALVGVRMSPTMSVRLQRALNAVNLVRAAVRAVVVIRITALTSSNVHFVVPANQAVSTVVPIPTLLIYERNLTSARAPGLGTGCPWSTGPWATTTSTGVMVRKKATTTSTGVIARKTTDASRPGRRERRPCGVFGVRPHPIDKQ